jgi:hypothetical protein
MDISHWKCRALQFLTLRNREGIFHAKEKVLPQAGCFFLDCWQEKFADVGSLQKAIWVKIEVFWPSVDRKDISEYV